MYKLTYISITLLCLSFVACSVSCAYSAKSKPKTEKVVVHETAQIVGLGEIGREYVVREVIDLKGKQVNVPNGVTISFKKGGAIVNGILNGKGTKINSKTDGVLGVKLTGTWCVEKVKDIVFSKEYLSDAEIISNLNVIQSDTVNNEITITRDYKVTIAKTGGAGLDLKSNTTLVLEATLALAPNDYKSYSIINIKGKENVTFKGGKIVGDVGCHTYIEDSSSEWGMGININESCNVTIKDVLISRCTGDGIYISGGYEPSVGIYDHASRNVEIRKVICDTNRRQGLSVIHVDGLTVRDCSFINTGQVEFTAPGSGIDVEPNVSNGRNMSVRNLIVDNCNITNNKGPAIATNNTYEKDGLQNYQNLLFSNCKTDGLLKAQSTDLTFRHCTFKEVRFASVYSPTHINLEDCIISGGYGVIIYAPSERGVHSQDRLIALDFKNCTLSAAEGETSTGSLISCYKKYIPNLEYVHMKGCRLVIPRVKSSSYRLTDYNFRNKLHITSSIIEMEGRELDASGMVLQGNRIRCAKAVKIIEGNNNRVLSSKDNRQHYKYKNVR